jgi:hypothetical protein
MRTVIWSLRSVTLHLARSLHLSTATVPPASLPHRDNQAADSDSKKHRQFFMCDRLAW